MVLGFARARRRTKLITGRFVAMLATGVVVIGVGVGLYFLASAPATITIGSGYVSLSSSSVFGTGNVDATAGQMVSAEVVLVGSGNWTLSKRGTNVGSLDIGVFTLPNGATAYVITDNSTALAIRLASGEYAIVGTSSTSTLVSDFSKMVRSVQNYSA